MDLNGTSGNYKLEIEKKDERRISKVFLSVTKTATFLTIHLMGWSLRFKFTFLVNVEGLKQAHRLNIS